MTREVQPIADPGDRLGPYGAADLERGRPVLSITDLTVIYGPAATGTVAARSVSLSVLAGEVTALIGESGSGKSTVVRAALDLLPATGRVMSGEVWLQGREGTVDLTTLRGEAQRERRWRDIAYVPQAAANSLNPLLRVAEHFVETATAHGVSAADATVRARSVLESVRLDGDRILSAYPHELSGGTRQRVMIALALLLEPMVVVLDEPTTGLDLITQRAIVEILADLMAQRSTGFLLVSHDLAVAEALADRLITLYAGQVVEDARMSAGWQPQHPYTQGLMAAIPDPMSAKRAVPIPGQPPDLRALPPGCPFSPRCAHVMDVCMTGGTPQLRRAGASVVACHLYPPNAGGTEQ